MGRRRKFIPFIPNDITEQEELKLIADWLYTDCERWIQMAIDSPSIRADLVGRINRAYRPHQDKNGLVLTLRQQ